MADIHPIFSSRYRTRLTVVVLSLFGFAHHTQARDTAPPLRTECVGRSQLNVPADVEFAYTSPKHWQEEEEGGGPIRFADGTVANGASFYYRGEVQVTDVINDSDFSLLRRKAARRADESRNYFLEHDNKQLAAAVLPLQTTGNLFGFQYGGAVEVFNRVGTRAIGILANVSDAQEKNKADAMYFVTHYRARDDFEVPNESGVCFPSGFLPDDGASLRDIAVAMRSKANPDLLITFEDNMRVLAKAKGSSQAIAGNMLLPSFERYFAKITSFKISDRKIDGRKGATILVRGTNKEGNASYAFGAVVTGDTNPLQAKPGLVLRVVYSPRTNREISVSQAQFIELAGKMTDTIKQRPVAN